MIVPCVEVEVKGDLQCRNVCNKKKNCGRHRCNTRCCVVRNTIISKSDTLDPEQPIIWAEVFLSLHPLPSQTPGYEAKEAWV